VKAGLGSLREVSDQWTIEELFEAHEFLNLEARAEQMAHNHAHEKARADKG
jgi:hypothetical protein